jgi:hypothetical protein
MPHLCEEGTRSLNTPHATRQAAIRVSACVLFQASQVLFTWPSGPEGRTRSSLALGSPDLGIRLLPVGSGGACGVAPRPSPRGRGTYATGASSLRALVYLLSDFPSSHLPVPSKIDIRKEVHGNSAEYRGR